jgi:hypothetical protein
MGGWKMGNLGFVLWLIGLSAMTFFAIAWLLDIGNRQRQIQNLVDKIFTDEAGQNLTEPLEALMRRLDASDEQMEQLRGDMAQLTSGLPHSIQAVGLVRFQAFIEYGGDQSFALVLADTAGDGVIISSIFARDGTRVYAKPLTGWTSSYSLSFEEEEAINQAQSRTHANGQP